ncbi:tpa inducible, partial [Fusarium agapanthi]
MAQPQPQTQMQVPPRAFSPPQHSPSPAASQSSFALPPQKRARTDGPSSQPESPYATSPYAVSPGATATPPAGTGSPAFAQSPA